MTPLRQRMIDAMVLRGFAARTQETYLTAVGQLARHHHHSPDLLSDEQVQAYLLYLLQERHRARSTVNMTACAMRFLVCDVLGQIERRPQIPLGRQPQRLPEVLSRAEVAALLGASMSMKAHSHPGLHWQQKVISSHRQFMQICRRDTYCHNIQKQIGGELP